MEQVGSSCRGFESELFLHPELLSRDFLLLSLGQKQIQVQGALNDKEKLTEIFVQHAMPLPQRDLPKSRWGKIMESKRGQNKVTEQHRKCASAENLRKRPLIVFDGSSTSTTIKVKKSENGENAQRLHPAITESTTCPLRNLGGSPVPRDCSSTALVREAKFTLNSNHGHPENAPQPDKTTLTVGSAVKIKRAAPKEETDAANDMKPTDAKKKIQHVTWP
ncbi:ashwin [Pelodytes ibericus]